MPRRRRPQVALVVESSRAFGRGVLRGIAAFLRERGPWSIFLQERGLADAPPRWLKDWAGDGVIARIENRQMARVLLQLGLPVVDLRASLELGLPRVVTDDPAIVRLAVDHLRERGFRQFAFCGFAGADYSEARERVFTRIVADSGFPCSVYRPPRRLQGADTLEHERQGLVYEAHLARWLRELPKPIGVMACNDIRGQQVLNACREVGVHVPDEVAVIGVDNDELLCELSDPPLSSVVQDTEKIGFEAAALLERLMAGRPAPKTPIVVEPLGVIARRSTDVLAIEDWEIAEAVRFMRDHACEGITVWDVLAQVPMSRTLFERRVAEVLGRTPKAELLRLQLDKVKELLRETDLPLAAVAAQAGFKHLEHLCAAFKQKTGVTLRQYRSLHHRPRGSSASAF
jgi:LacI family transcriptional regulator